MVNHLIIFCRILGICLLAKTEIRVRKGGRQTALCDVVEEFMSKGHKS